MLFWRFSWKTGFPNSWSEIDENIGMPGPWSFGSSNNSAFSVSGHVVPRSSCYSKCFFFLIQSCYSNFAIFTGKHLCWSLFSIKFQGWRAPTLLIRDSNTRVLLWILQNFYSPGAKCLFLGWPWHPDIRGFFLIFC